MNERILPQDPRGGNRRSEDRRQGDRRKGQRGGRRRSDKSGIKTLLFLCFAAMIGLGLFIVFETNIGIGVDWYKMFFTKDKVKKNFAMGDVSLGMSSDMVKKQHPNLEIVLLGSGESVGSFSLEGAHYTVWFVNINGRDQAYRMRYDQSYRTRSEADILESIGQVHGKPGTSECSKAGDMEIKCHFQWWPSGGTSLNVSTTEKKSKQGQMQTDVTMIATDTYLDGKRMRLKTRPVTPKTTAGQKKSSEKLPF